MNEKAGRHDERILCADLIKIVWTDKAGSRQKEMAALEDISPRGVCLQTEHPIPVDTSIAILYPSGRYHGRIRYCEFQDTGYFLGVEFDHGYQWSRHEFTPSHLLDLRRARGKTRRAEAACKQS
jgi:hypothetical protein